MSGQDALALAAGLLAPESKWEGLTVAEARERLAPYLDPSHPLDRDILRRLAELPPGTRL
ncbi:MAG TPA: hypothetical protein VNT60_08560 [Deinococcales bacterium]|nr:hypothetical protein [Deinococcales bacterium]